MLIIRTEKEIDEVYEEAMNTEAVGKSNFPGMTYEQGIIALYDWLTRPNSANPMED